MAGKVKRLFSLWAHYAKMDAQWFAQDTGMFLLVVFSETIANFAAVTGLFLLAVRFGGVGDMSVDEMLFMLGFYTLSTGLVNMMDGGNALNISRRVGRGQLDHCLIQPLPLWMQLATEGFLPVSGSAGALCGLGFLLFAAARLRLAVSPLWVLGTVLFVLCSFAIQVGMRYIVSLSAFFHPAGSEEISAVMGGFLSSLGYYPLSGLPGWARAALNTVLPAGCLSWLPTLILLGKAPSPTLSFFYPLFAVLIFGAGVTTFQKGMKLYAKRGSSRYKAMGHRS